MCKTIVDIVQRLCKCDDNNTQNWCPGARTGALVVISTVKQTNPSQNEGYGCSEAYP